MAFSAKLKNEENEYKRKKSTQKKESKIIYLNLFNLQVFKFIFRYGKYSKAKKKTNRKILHTSIRNPWDVPFRMLLLKSIYLSLWFCKGYMLRVINNGIVWKFSSWIYRLQHLGIRSEHSHSNPLNPRKVIFFSIQILFPFSVT